MSLRLGTLEEAGQAAWYKLFTQAGEIWSEGGQLAFRPRLPGRHEIAAYAVRDDGRIAGGKLIVMAS
jgi:hypothetical protein